MVVGCGAALANATSLLMLLVSFEAMLLAALLLLRNTAKSERAAEALAEMFLWALVGSACLILGFLAHTNSGAWGTTTTPVSLYAAEGASILLLLGFGVKVPLWPFVS